MIPETAIYPIFKDTNEDFLVCLELSGKTISLLIQRKKPRAQSVRISYDCYLKLISNQRLIAGSIEVLRAQQNIESLQDTPKIPLELGEENGEEQDEFSTD